MYLSSTLSNTLLQKVLILVQLKSSVQEVFVSTMTAFLSYSYEFLEESITHTKSLKLKRYPWGNVTDFFVEILVDAEHQDFYKEICNILPWISF